jgi:hypothetical protein
MKRAHPHTAAELELGQLERDCAAAKARYDALAKQVWTHPVTVAQRAQVARDELAAKVPPALHDAWITRAGLTELDMLGYAEDDGECAFRAWQFKARFAPATPNSRHNGKVVSCATTMRFDDFTQEWEFDEADVYPVDFDADAGHMWETALHVNDSDVGAALTAFCHACCLETGDMSAPPSAAFRTRRR